MFFTYRVSIQLGFSSIKDFVKLFIIILEIWCFVFLEYNIVAAQTGSEDISTPSILLVVNFFISKILQ